MGLMLLFGTCNTLLMKGQDNVVIGKSTTDKDKNGNFIDLTYTHPYV